MEYHRSTIGVLYEYYWNSIKVLTQTLSARLGEANRKNCSQNSIIHNELSLQTNATETKLELKHEIEPIIQVLVAVQSFS